MPKPDLTSWYSLTHTERIGWGRYLRLIPLGVAVGATAVALGLLWSVNSARPELLGSDLMQGYLVGAQRFLDTGSPYTPEQLAGPFELSFHTFIHPPSALPLFVPFLWLPAILWWMVPIAITTYCLVRLRPAPWALATIALLLCWPRSTGALLSGNTDMWATAIVAMGTVWSWPVVGLVIKPTLAPLALIGIKQRSTWIAGALLAGLSLLLLPIWLDWWSVIRNANLPLTYSLLNLPLVLIPLVGWLGRRRQTAAATSEGRTAAAPSS